ncbi:medium-chain acyl-CoA ligase ACSF2, mitochondrial-like [Atheta coriaria]|uniref:medium-chain acyl-CoA ligase ACSF2, mitochondrial-like n=1 Tax=Dalotia coriaria TaxID=877792 RepID=UPI0031F426F0
MIKNTVEMNQKPPKIWSYQQQLSTFPLQGITAGQLLENAAKKYPDRLAVISAYQSKSITFGELLTQADRFAAGLMNIGIAKGDYVAIWAPNSIEWVIVSLGCARGGFVLAQLNHSYKSNELLYSVNKVGIKALVCGCNSVKQNYYSILKQVDDRMFQTKETLPKVKSAKMESLQFVISLTDNEGTIPYNDVFSQATATTLKYIKNNQYKLSMDDPLNIQFTSGSTGNPKAALLSHHNVVNNSYSIGRRFGMHEKHHSICVSVPFFHTFGTTVGIFCALNFGATLVLPYNYYDPKQCFQTIAQHKCSIIYGTPTMYVDLIAQQKQLNIEILPEIICTGGAPYTKQLINDVFERLKPKYIVNVYGMTEGSAVMYQSNRQSENIKIFLGDHIEAKVIDENGIIVPIGTPGELCVRGYNTMIGYYNDDDLTSKTFMKNRWLRTGDKFVMYDDLSGQVIGRIKDIIIRGGENIHPKEIEDYISTHPSILNVVGLPHVRLGEEICACVRLEDNMIITLDEIKDFCKQHMAHYKIPSKMHIVNEFPKTTSGKIQKFKLVQQLTQ